MLGLQFRLVLLVASTAASLLLHVYVSHWLYYDARARGRSGVLWVFLYWLLLGLVPLLLWLIKRPRLREERAVGPPEGRAAVRSRCPGPHGPVGRSWEEVEVAVTEEQGGLRRDGHGTGNAWRVAAFVFFGIAFIGSLLIVLGVLTWMQADRVAGSADSATGMFKTVEQAKALGNALPLAFSARQSALIGLAFLLPGVFLGLVSIFKARHR